MMIDLIKDVNTWKIMNTFSGDLIYINFTKYHIYLLTNNKLTIHKPDGSFSIRSFCEDFPSLKNFVESSTPSNIEYYHRPKSESLNIFIKKINSITVFKKEDLDLLR